MVTLDHEAHYGARRVELAAVARRITHFAQQRFVQPPEGVHFLGTVEVDGVDQVDHIAQQITALHAVGDAPEYRRDHIASVASAIGAAQARADRQTGLGLRCHPATWPFRRLIKVSKSGPVMPSWSAAQSRQRYGGSMAEAERLAC